MISVLIPTLNAETYLPRTLSALVGAAVDGVVLDVTIADGGSTDRTELIAEAAGANFISGSGPAAGRLADAVGMGRGRWLLFLDARTELEAGWERAADAYMRAVESGAALPGAAVFRFAAGEGGLRSRMHQAGTLLAEAMGGGHRLTRGLLVSRALYHDLGGFVSGQRGDGVVIKGLSRSRITTLPPRAFRQSTVQVANQMPRGLVRNTA